MSGLSAVVYREAKIRATNLTFIFWDVVYPLGYLRADLGRDRLAVDDRGRHGPNPTRGPDRPPKLSDGSGVGW